MNLLRNRYAVLASALPLLLSSVPAWAEEAEGGSLPQLNPALFPEQIFWLILSFALLYVLMSRVALPRVTKTQENRSGILMAEVEAARLANNQAMAMVASSEKALANARLKAQESVSNMIAKVTEEAAAHQAAQERELQRSLHNAEAEIAVIREGALKHVDASAADIAKDIVAKILSPRERVRA
jgi:F-type H+-transporting ATPase subunit b